jgi:hypothetical protein
MATATLNKDFTERPKLITTYERVDNSTVDLELSLPEAQTLLKVVRNVGGSEMLSRRRHTQNIVTALERAGVWPAGHDFFVGQIRFTDELNHNEVAK